MIRTHKKQLTLASLLTLLPIPVGLLLKDHLPPYAPLHWGLDGQPDGWGNPLTAFLILPLLLLALFWLCIWFTAKDPGNREGRNTKPFSMVLWIMPVLSNLISGIMYALMLGLEFSITNVMTGVLGLAFAVMGNYMPKCQMNSTIGIKIYWTYTSEENWNATHRFAGRLWVIGGLLTAATALIPGSLGGIAVVLFLIPMAVVPMVYSYRYYKKQIARGDELKPMPTLNKGSKRISLVFVALILIFCAFILFTGDVEVVFSDTSFTVDATYHESLTVDYSAVDALELREEDVPGTRAMGFGSARLLLGYFENREFGGYTRYTYTNPDACIVITVGDNVLVISGRDAADTRAIYDTLVQRTGK